MVVGPFIYRIPPAFWQPMRHFRCRFRAHRALFRWEGAVAPGDSNDKVARMEPGSPAWTRRRSAGQLKLGVHDLGALKKMADIFKMNDSLEFRRDSVTA